MSSELLSLLAMHRQSGILNKSSVLGVGQRIISLMDRSEKLRALVMLGSVFFGSVIELLGLAAIIPVIGLAVNPNLIHRYDWLESLFVISAQWGLETERQFLIGLCCGLVVIFLLKVFSSIIITFFQTRFSFDVAHRLSGVMWTYHFSQSLQDLRASDSGLILEEIKSWPIAFANVFLVGLIKLLTEVVVITAIGVGLLVYSPIVSISVVLLMLFGVVIIRLMTNSRVKAYGSIEREIAPKTNGMIANATRGFLEIITFGAVIPVRNEYLRLTKTLFNVKSRSSVVFSIPAKTYELLASFGICGAIIISLVVGVEGEDFFELLSLMAVSAYRVMPSMSRMNSLVMGMRKDKFVLEAMERGVAHHFKASGDKSALVELSGNCPCIELKELELGYKSLDKPVIEGLNYRFEAGGIYAIVGMSGSGKSTLVSSILGLHNPDSGAVLVDMGEGAYDLYGEVGARNWLNNVGYLSQQPFLFKGTVEHNFTFRNPEAMLDPEFIANLMERLGLRDVLGQQGLKFELNEGGSNLSGGQQQRLALLRALQTKSPVLMLDEATSALDEHTRDLVFDLLRDKAAGGDLIILITHDLSLAKCCDHMLNLSEI